jgi:hypothetical protein
MPRRKTEPGRRGRAEPKARALFDTSAEVPGGLITAYDDYEQGTPACR